MSLFVPLALALASSPAQQATKAAPVPAILAIEHVAVIPMDRERVLSDQTVIVESGKIAKLGPASSVKPPAGARRIDGRGAFLIPGLIDTHVHVFDPCELAVFLAHGVTGVRNLLGFPMHLELRDRIESGELVGPRLWTSGPFTNLPEVKDAEAAAQTVDEQKRAGFDCVKIHGGLDLDTLRALGASAKAAGLPLVGHIPRNLDAKTVLESGTMVEISHAEEFLYTWFDEREKPRELASIDEIAKLVAEKGVAVSPTLVAYESIGDQVADLDSVLARPEHRFVAPLIRLTWTASLNRYARDFSTGDAPALRENLVFQREMVKRFHAAGVTLLTGTDANNPSVVPGFSVRRELELLVASGLSRFDALVCATHNPARFLTGRAAAGTIAEGEAADLVLLEANPLEDIGATQRIRGVAVRGRWLAREDLDRSIAELEAEFEAEREFVSHVEIDNVERASDFYTDRKREAPNALVAREGTLAMLALLYGRVRKPALAVEAARLGVEAYSSSYSAWNRLAETLTNVGDAEGAKKAYERSLELRPGNRLAARALTANAASR